MTKYKSGDPRVHALAPVAELKAAIAEYEAFDADPVLAAELRATAKNLREELEIRERQEATS